MYGFNKQGKPLSCFLALTTKGDQELHNWSEGWHFETAEGLHTQKTPGLLHWSGAKNQKKTMERPGRLTRGGVEPRDQLVLKEKKIGWGHHPQCLIRQCFYPASTLKPGLVCCCCLPESNSTTLQRRSQNSGWQRGDIIYPNSYRGRKSSVGEKWSDNKLKGRGRKKKAEENGRWEDKKINGKKTKQNEAYTSRNREREKGRE